MKKKKILSVFLFLLFISFTAPIFADGCFFGYKDIEEPSQVGVILKDRGTEDLILFVNAQGDVNDFAWVVPVPSYPTLSEGDPDLFFDLSYLTTYTPSPPIFSCGTGDIVYAPGNSGVHIWESADIGVYKTTILSADNPSALINWLNENGYKFPEDAQDAVDYYINKRYFFIAMKVKKENEEISQYYMGINPIRIHFSADKPIYPLKISSISASSTTEVLLYIFGHIPWEYPGFNVEYSSYITPKDYAGLGGISKLLNGKSLYLTKMRAILSPSDMKEDLIFSTCRQHREASMLSAPTLQLLAISLIALLFIHKIR